MTKVAATTVQPAGRPATVQPAAPAVLKKDAALPVVASPVAPSLPPQASPVATAVLAALIDVQAKVKPIDPQPTHGADDEHGHKPPVTEPPPPVVEPPVVQPPVVQPPVVQPPVVTPPPVPPTPAPRPVAADPAVARRALVILDQTLTERDAIRQENAAFTTFAAERQSFSAVMENNSAVALLSVLQAGITQFDESFSASKLRGSLYA